jgi:hypothetical protein
LVTDRVEQVRHHGDECFIPQSHPVPPAADIINRPAHYNYGKVEVIDYIMQVCALYPGHQAALVANLIKYVSRAPIKSNKEEDLKKAQWYMNKLVETL